jgi:translation initiation factor IF-2
VARDAQWVNILGLQEQREQQKEEMEQQREQMEQLKDERFVHLQALIDMDGQLEAMDKDLEAANKLIQVLQQPAPPASPGSYGV